MNLTVYLVYNVYANWIRKLLFSVQFCKLNIIDLF